MQAVKAFAAKLISHQQHSKQNTLAQAHTCTSVTKLLCMHHVSATTLIYLQLGAIVCGMDADQRSPL